MNPLFNRQQFNQTPQNNTPFGNMTNMMNQFNQFRNTFRGNPQQIVMNMLSNGQMSQQQFNQLKAMADQFQKMMH